MFGASAAATAAVMAPTDPRKIFSIKYSYSGEKIERCRRCCGKPYGRGKKGDKKQAIL
jgi:hypothetical protein